jgi:hypothetical protein
MTAETVETTAATEPITTGETPVAGPAVQDNVNPDKTTADLDKERERTPTSYVILAYAESQSAWLEVTTVQAPNQPEAKKLAVKENSVLRERVNDGHAVTLVAVARNSWKPTTVQLRRSEDVVFS